MLEPDPAPGTRPLDGQFYPLVVTNPSHFSVLGLLWLPLGATWARFGGGWASMLEVFGDHFLF